jgi:hypothetical protein
MTNPQRFVESIANRETDFDWWYVDVVEGGVGRRRAGVTVGSTNFLDLTRSTHSLAL